MQRASCLMLLSYLLQTILAETNATAQIPKEYTYLLPRPFNNTFTAPFIDTNISDQTTQELFSHARTSPFISYSSEFDKILGSSPSVSLIANNSKPVAFEGGIWVPPPINQIWFTAFLDPTPGYLTILDLNTSAYFQPRLVGPAANIPVNPNGGYYFDGLIYLTSFGNETISPAIVSINPTTYETKEIINSFYGLPLNGPDDVTLLRNRKNETCLFYTDFYFAAEGLPGVWSAPQQLPNAVWLFKSASKSLQMAISPLDVQTPNGIAVNREGTKLYVSDGPDSAVFGVPYNGTTKSGSPIGSAGIYVFDLDDDCMPMNKRMLGVARQGFANGIKIDDFGRIWTFEYEGVVVRDFRGKVLGVINIYAIAGRDSPDVAPGANFALVRDEVYLLGFTKIWKVKLGEVVKTWY